MDVRQTSESESDSREFRSEMKVPNSKRSFLIPPQETISRSVNRAGGRSKNVLICSCVMRILLRERDLRFGNRSVTLSRNDPSTPAQSQSWIVFTLDPKDIPSCVSMASSKRGAFLLSKHIVRGGKSASSMIRMRSGKFREMIRRRSKWAQF